MGWKPSKLNQDGCSGANNTGSRKGISMTKEMDFSSLSIKDALDLAILIEEEAKERYKEFVDQMTVHHNPEAAAFFRQMIGNEAKHEAELLQHRQLLFRNAPSRMNRSMLLDVEAPDYDQTRTFMPARQAMVTALQAEIKAYNYFDKALKHITEPAVKRLFEELRDEEVVHQDLVRKEMAKLPPDSGFDPEAFADEPTAQ
jgi:erythrin-vacuolar iron transport family protein